MFYTLSKGLLWVVLAFLIGVLTGWFARQVAARRQIARARAHNGDHAEMARLRARVAELEGVPTTVAAATAAGEADAPSGRQPPGGEQAMRAKPTRGARSHHSAPAASEAEGKVQPLVGEGVTNQATPASSPPAPAAAPAMAAPLPAAAPDEPAAPAAPALDLAAAASVLGRSVALDDLQVVEGIGPKIEMLCHSIGIRSWSELADTEVSLLRTMLADAGSRFRTHDPGTWPQQAGLLAAGRWEEFKALTDSLRGGKAE